MTEFKRQSEFPLFETYAKVFPFVKDNPNVVFAYNNTIYCNGSLPDHLIIHEETHLKQQNQIGLDLWVERYLEDIPFRLGQEIEAYQNQLDSVKDRNERLRLKLRVIQDLSGPLYGNILSKEEAEKILK